jgi:transcriptional regulator GlxA family with amidase domain
VLRDILADIDRELAQPIAVADLARRFRLSHNHLTRLFRSHLGRTVVAWLRHRRAERARELLLHSDLPLAEIGRRVGLSDAQRLNKVLRGEFGQSPRQLRRSAPPIIRAGPSPAGWQR